jgi:hypothetical protein
MQKEQESESGVRRSLRHFAEHRPCLVGYRTTPLPRWRRSARSAPPSTAALLVLTAFLASAVIFATDATFHRV